jgi:EAL domain-containing protein (putative c-di-GMP-specific phosphodiesterase class I)
MANPAAEKNIKLLKMMKQALDNELLVPSYQPLLEVRAPTRKSFQLGCDLETTTGQLIPYATLQRLARLTGTNRELDRWLMKIGLATLKHLHSEQPEARLVVPQSAAAFTNEEYIQWLERQKELADVSTHGLVIAFRLSQISQYLVEAHECISALHKSDIETMIEGFSHHPAAIKVLRAMNSHYVSVSESLQQTEDGIIEHRIQECRKLGVKILLPEIHTPEEVNLFWATGADLLAGNYIHPPVRDIDFSFPPTVI